MMSKFQRKRPSENQKQSIFKYFKRCNEESQPRRSDSDGQSSTRSSTSSSTTAAAGTSNSSIACDHGYDRPQSTSDSMTVDRDNDEIKSSGSFESEKVAEKKDRKILFSEGKEHILSTFNAMFEGIDTCTNEIDTAGVHNYYLCHEQCSKLNDDHLRGKQGQKRETKFLHEWLTSPETSFDKNTGLWWLVYVENVGMYCSLCKKHDTCNPKNKSKAWNVTPSVRLRKLAILEHVGTEQHKSAINTEMLQRVSTFQKELNEKNRVNKTVLEKTFHAIYWLAKHEVSNTKLIPLIELVESLGVNDLKYFKHRSRPSIQEMFLTLGETVQQLLLERIQNCNAFGLLADEVTDVAVLEQLIMFVKYFDGELGEARTEFLGMDTISESEGANAHVVTNKIVHILEECNLQIEKLKSFVSDGANVMVGKHNGVAARLRRLNKLLLNFHCICHRLALACVDTEKDVAYIKEVATTLTHAWNFFEHSPKRTSTFVNIQSSLAETNFSDKCKKYVSKKVKRACATRWLSFDHSVQSAYENYVALLQTFQELQKDPTALGLYKKMKKPKFLGALYILHSVLPSLSNLSKTFQIGALNFSHVSPAIQYTVSTISTIQDPIEKLEDDLKGRLILLDMQLTQQDKNQIKTLHTKYIDSLKENINNRFSESLNLLSAFHIFNPLEIPKPESSEFINYGVKDINYLAGHYYQDLDQKDVLTQELLAEWGKFKFDILNMKNSMPDNVKNRHTGNNNGNKQHNAKDVPTPIEWTLLKTMTMKSEYGYFYPRLVEIVEIALSTPVTNAWPERGASALKRIKTRLRNRLSKRMMNALLQISINGPEPLSLTADTLIKQSVNNWLSKKTRRKLKNVSIEFDTTASETEAEEIPEVREQSVQCDDNDFDLELQVAKKIFNLPDCEDDNDSAFSDDDYSDDDDLMF